MPVCPVCESSQPQGDACDVCGKPFAAADRSAPPIPAIDGLEPTLHAAVPEPRDSLPDLEPTSARPVTGVAAAAVEGLEPTGHAAVADVAPEPVELEPTHAEKVPDDGARGGPMLCRYCRTPATGWETLCLRCGMRLPVLRLTRRGAPADVRTCADCGAPSPRATCPACGARQKGDA